MKRPSAEIDGWELLLSACLPLDETLTRSVLPAQAGVIAASSSPAAASKAHPHGGPLSRLRFSAMLVPPPRARPRHGGWSGSGDGRTRLPARGIAGRADLFDVYQNG